MSEWKKYPHFLHSYEVIQECWNERPEQRPTFNNLYRTFDSFLSKNTQEFHPYIELLEQEDAGKYKSSDFETPQLDRTPVNLDPVVAHTNGNATSLKKSRSTEIFHQFLSSSDPFSDLQIKSSSTHFSHRSSTLPVEMQQPLSWKERKKIFNEGMEMKTRYVDLSHGGLARGAPPLPETLLQVHNQDQRNWAYSILTTRDCVVSRSSVHLCKNVYMDNNNAHVLYDTVLVLSCHVW